MTGMLCLGRGDRPLGAGKRRGVALLMVALALTLALALALAKGVRQGFQCRCCQGIETPSVLKCWLLRRELG